jgi:hypothetical protein
LAGCARCAGRDTRLICRLRSFNQEIGILKTIIFIEHDQDTDEFEYRFARRFNDMTREQQLLATEAAIKRLESLSQSLKVIIARQSADNS